jgi:flagellar basal body P-ring formation protein FlgA
MRPVLLIAALCCAAPCHAATLRPAATLHGPNVYLHDLFDDAGPNADRLLGNGPGPGGRYIVEAAQLAVIARQFGVEWRPASRADRILVEWPGRPMRRDDALTAVRDALITAGASSDCAIELPGFNPPTVPNGAEPRPVVTQLEYDSDTGRFTAVLSVVGDGMDAINTRLSGRVDDTVELPVTTARLPAGTVLRAEDVHMVRLHTAAVRGEVAHLAAEAVGKQLRRQIAPGQTLALADLALPTAVQRGSAVRLLLRTNVLALSGQGIALESGAAGERIRVQNIGSRAVLDAEVIGPGEVRVEPLQAIARGDLAVSR